VRRWIEHLRAREVGVTRIDCGNDIQQLVDEGLSPAFCAPLLDKSLVAGVPFGVAEDVAFQYRGSAA